MNKDTELSNEGTPTDAELLYLSLYRGTKKVTIELLDSVTPTTAIITYAIAVSSSKIVTKILNAAEVGAIKPHHVMLARHLKRWRLYELLAELVTVEPVVTPTGPEWVR